MEDNRDASLCMLSVIETTQSIRFEDATFRGYSGPLRTLNGELVLIVPLRGPNVPRTNPVLNGILQGSPLNAAALMIPQSTVLLLQRGKIQIPPKSTVQIGFLLDLQMLWH